MKFFGIIYFELVIKVYSLGYVIVYVILKTTKNTPLTC